MRSGQLNVRLRASDQGSGISQIAIVAGGQSDVARADCAPACPHRFETTLSLDQTGLTEGRRTVRLIADNSAGTRTIERLPVVIDRTDPLPPTDPAVAASSDGQSINLSWTKGDDPMLADGSPGSGVVATRLRYRTSDGTWSDWQETTATSFAVGAAELSSSDPTMELASVDRSGRQSDVASLATRPPCSINMDIRETPRSYSTKTTSVDEHYAAVKGFSFARCNEDIAGAGTSITLKLVEPSGIANPPKAVTKKQAPEVGQFDTGEVEMDCVPGIQTYELDVAFVAIGGFEGQVSGGTTRFTMICNQDGMWRHQAWADGGKVPSAKLGARMILAGELPGGVRGFQAHHIVPAFEKRRGAADTQWLGYQCRIHPNYPINGVWIPAKLNRQINNRAYYHWVYDSLQKATAGRKLGGCDYHHAWLVLRHIKTVISSGAAFPGKPGT